MAPTNDFRGGALRARALAAGIHLGLSLIAVGLLAGWMLLAWYPPPYFMADGGWRVLRIIVLVDVILGPLLTLIVFNRAKPELRRDLALIALVQVAALAYGSAVMYQYRPAFVVAAERNLYTVNWPDLERAGGDLAAAHAVAGRGRGPSLVFLQLPDSVLERERLWRRASLGGVPPTHEAARYRAPSPGAFDALLNPGADIEALARTDASIAQELAQVLKRHPDIPRERLAFVPLNCRFELIMLVFDRGTRQVVDWMT